MTSAQMICSVVTAEGKKAGRGERVLAGDIGITVVVAQNKD